MAIDCNFVEIGGDASGAAKSMGRYYLTQKGKDVQLSMRSVNDIGVYKKEFGGRDYRAMRLGEESLYRYRVE